MKKILSKHLVKSAKKFWKKGEWWFQQDNDPKHTSRLVKNFLFVKVDPIAKVTVDLLLRAK